MPRHILSWFLIPVLLVTLSGNAFARLDSGVLDQTALIAVAINSPQDLVDFQNTGLPVYTRWATESGQMILSGASIADLNRLSESGLEYLQLDNEVSGESYYFASAAPGDPFIDYEVFGQVLFEGEDRVLLKATPISIKQLAATGVQVRAVSLEPKPLLPSVPQFKAPVLLEPDPDVQNMIDSVDAGTVYTYSGNLTGRWPVMIDGAPYTITSRTTFSGEPLEKATRLVGTHMEALGLDVEYHTWNANYPPNVIGQRTGFSQPDDIFIIGAHLDNLPYGAVAPGMDDNGSGSVGVLIAADILSQYHWDCTLRFVFWTGEEQGLLGSSAYAQRAAANAENIQGVLNLDMIAWNTGGTDPTIELHATSILTPTLEVAQLFVDVVDTYALALDPEIIPNGTDRSDHASFWDWGYTAILGIEDFGGDFNPNYHTTADTYDNLQDVPYFVEYIKGAVAMYAHLVGCRITDGLGTLGGSVSALEGGMTLEGAIIEAETSQGYRFLTPVSPSGVYTTSLAAGVYTVTASAPGYLADSIYPVSILTDTLTTLNFALQIPERVYFPLVNVIDP